MNKKKIRERLPEPKTIKKPLPIVTSSSPANAKPNVVRSPKKSRMSELEKFEKIGLEIGIVSDFKVTSSKKISEIEYVSATEGKQVIGLHCLPNADSFALQCVTYCIDKFFVKH